MGDMADYYGKDDYYPDPNDDDMAGYYGGIDFGEAEDETVIIIETLINGQPGSVTQVTMKESQLSKKMQQVVLLSKKVWTGKDGTATAVKDMTDSHLMNTIKVLQGDSPHGTQWHGSEEMRGKWWTVLVDEAINRGLSLKFL